MKNTLLVAVCALQVQFFICAISKAQSVSITDDGTPAHSSAMLEIKVSGANKKGMLIPRMTTAQRNAIANPAKGLLVYDSTNKNFFFHTGTVWMPISSGTPNNWTITGSSIYSNNPGNVGIGARSPKAKLHVASGGTVLFGPDTLSSVGGAQFVFFASKGAFRFRTAYSAGVYPEPMPYAYNAIGDNSFAAGETTADAYGFAIGNASSAGRNGFAQGFGCFAGNAGFARGTYAVAEGDNSYATGLNCFSTGQYSFTHGYELEARAKGCMVIGGYNDPIAASSPTEWLDRDPIFIIGKGGFTGTRSNALVVLKNAVTGININPIAEESSWGMLQVKNTTGKDHLTLVQSSTSNRWSAAVPDAGTADLFLKYNGTSKGKFSTINGAYTLISDMRLKKDITPLNEVLPALMKVKAYRYHYLDNNSGDPLSQGFMAQEVAEIFPSFVSHVDERNGEKMLGIDYNNFIVLAIKGIQEQQQVIEQQKTLIEKQQKQIDDLVDRMNALEKNSK